MMVIAFDGTVVNLNKYEKVEAKQALGIFGKLVDWEEYVVIATLTRPGFLGNRIEKEVLGIYNSEYRAKDIQKMLAKAWCANNETFVMPMY